MKIVRLYHLSVTSPKRAAMWLDRIERWKPQHGWLVDVLTALALAAVLGALTISGAQGLSWQTGWLVTVVVAFTVLHVTVALRRRWPQSAYGAAGLAMLVIVLAPEARVTNPVSGGPTHVPALFLPSSLVFLVLLFNVAAQDTAARGRLALVTALAGVGVATARTADTLNQFTAGGWLVAFSFCVGLILVVLMTWLVGRFALARRQRVVADRAEAARLAVLEERGRIAREMHDIVAHSLAVIARQAEGGAFVAERDGVTAGQALRTIAATSRAALTDMRGLLGVLRDPDPNIRDGSVDPPQPGLADLPRLVAGVRDSGVDAELVASGEPFNVGAATELAVYRLAQEGLTNAVKHAGPQARVAVTLHWQPERLTVEVVDDGGGPRRAALVPGAGAGLQGLRERVAAVGGTVTATPRETGFAVLASFPRTVSPA
jgi:signal transduction histidine kinase